MNLQWENNDVPGGHSRGIRKVAVKIPSPRALIVADKARRNCDTRDRERVLRLFARYRL
jgi:hypothetical protein